MVRFLLVLCLISSINSAVYAGGEALLHGHIRSENGVPLVGATVRLKELPASAGTDVNGYFSFSKLSYGSYTLVVSMVGYNELTQVVGVNDTSVRLDLALSTSSRQLEPVMVTAEKRESNLQHVPVAVSSISGKQIERRKINEVGDLLLSVPNLMTMNVGAPTLSTIAIRGILTFSVDPAVGVYVDGVPMFDGYSSSIQFQNLERIEVLRGPQSTLYGRNALGGIISIITRQPDNKLRGFAEAGIGNYGSQRYGLGISGALIPNKLFAGISGLYDTRGGIYTNKFNNEKYDRYHTSSGNLFLKYLASSKLSFTLNARTEHNNVRGTFPYVVNADSALKYPYTINQDGTNIEKRRLYTVSLSAQYKTGKTQITSTTAYTHLDDRYEDYDTDYSPYNLMKYEMPLQKQKTFTQEFRVTGEYGKLKLTAGLFGFIDTKPSQTVYNYGEDAAVMYPGAPYTTNIYARKKIYGVAGYANLDYAVTSRLTVSAGLRYDYDNRNLRFSMDYVKSPNPPVVVSPEKNIDGHNNAVSPRITVSYKAGKDLMVYANYARGFRSGGFNQYTTEPNLLNYKPEYTDNYEVGVKSEWFDHRLRLNAALFFTNWKDQQQSLMLPALTIMNVGEMTSKGAELELNSILAKGLELNFNVGVVESDYKKLLLPDGTGGNKEQEGKKQVFTPSFNAAIALSYRYAISEKWSVYVCPEWKYLGKQYMTYYNDLEQSAFSLFNASAGIQHSIWELSIWGKNISDQRYLSFAYATYNRASSPVLLGLPRTYGATLKVKF